VSPDLLGDVGVVELDPDDDALQVPITAVVLTLEAARASEPWPPMSGAVFAATAISATLQPFQLERCLEQRRAERSGTVPGSSSATIARRSRRRLPTRWLGPLACGSGSPTDGSGGSPAPGWCWRITATPPIQPGWFRGGRGMIDLWRAVAGRTSSPG
jgi:hypothetical protein